MYFNTPWLRIKNVFRILDWNKIKENLDLINNSIQLTSDFN